MSENKQRVTRMTADGLNSGQIAERLGISLLAVQRYQRLLWRDLGLTHLSPVNRAAELRRILSGEPGKD